MWPSLTLGGRPIPIPPVQNGPAVKYLAEVRSRYWIRQGDAPSGAADDMGGLWEGTDNQMGSSGIDLTVFAGGPAAMAVGTSPSAHFDPKLEALLPGYHNNRVRSDFANWPAEPFIRTGYSCPAPRQVMTSVLWMQQAMAGRIFFAGEHASPQFFGYMEGALRSGVAAAARILAVSSLQAPASTSGLSGRGVALHLPAVAHH